MLYDPKWDTKVDNKLDVLRRWVDALRSGEHTQCYGDVEVGNRMCAVGLLLHVAGAPLRLGGDAIFRGVGNYSTAEELLRPIELSALDIWVMNDQQRLTFRQIAGRVEKHIQKAT
jgi:hypothetical protein